MWEIGLEVEKLSDRAIYEKSAPKLHEKAGGAVPTFLSGREGEIHWKNLSRQQKRSIDLRSARPILAAPGFPTLLPELAEATRRRLKTIP
jgi:hypothetical protein